MDEDEQKILVRAIIEMLGAPKEHIEKTLADFVEKLKKEHEVKQVHLEPAKEQDQYFSVFAELEIYFKNVNDLIGFCFDAMPSSVEVIEPEKWQITNQDLSNALNDLQAKNHETDMLLKNMKSANKLLDQNTMNLFRNFIKYLTKDGEKSLDELSEATGIGSKYLKQFLDRLVENNMVSLTEGKYKFQDEH